MSTFALIYHDVVEADRREEAGFPGPLAARYKLTPEHFERHLHAIGQTGRTVGLAADDPDCAITFDDGGASALLAAEMLERHGWRGHFFITTGRVGTPGFLDGDGVRELAARGHEVGGHSHTHPTFMGKLDRPTIATEWATCREALTEILGSPPPTASVPGGFTTRAVVEEAERAGFGLLMTSEPSQRPPRAAVMTTMGRYTIWSTTSEAQAAGYAAGSKLARGRLWLEWNAKGLVKKAAPGIYQAGRRLRARGG